MENPVYYFDENKEAIQTIVDLLRSVYQHYPVGYRHFAKKYGGYQEMQRIVAKKIDIECNDSNSISNRLFAELEADLPDHGLENRSYLNFPSYSFDIHLLSEDLGPIGHDFTLNLIISLVSDYYSIALIDSYNIQGVTKESVGPKRIDSRHSIYSFLSSLHRVSGDIIPLVNKKVTQYFPEKTFISHSLLMEPPFVTGIAPFGEEIGWDTPSSFWQLLFSNDFISGAVVLE